MMIQAASKYHRMKKMMKDIIYMMLDTEATLIKSKV